MKHQWRQGLSTLCLPTRRQPTLTIPALWGLCSVAATICAGRVTQRSIFDWARTFRSGGNLGLKFRADAFNTLNHPNFQTPCSPYYGSHLPVRDRVEHGPRTFQLQHYRACPAGRAAAGVLIQPSATSSQPKAASATLFAARLPGRLLSADCRKEANSETWSCTACPAARA